MNHNPKAYIVDSFTSEPFKGNPAGVVLCNQPLEKQKMQAIAAEFNFSETAFLIPKSNNGEWSIRYFSPLKEIPLCGHATLAAAKVLFLDSSLSAIHLMTGQNLNLEVQRSDDRIEMFFPNYALEKTEAPSAMLDALGIEKVLFAGFNHETNILMLEIDSAQDLGDLEPEFDALLASHDSIDGVSITAVSPDDCEFDFHSRFFWPWAGGEEDPVTGAVHSFLAPYWSKKLKKNRMQSFQASERTGCMEVEIVNDDSILIRGNAVLILEGELKI